MRGSQRFWREARECVREGGGRRPGREVLFGVLPPIKGLVRPKEDAECILKTFFVYLASAHCRTIVEHRPLGTRLQVYNTLYHVTPHNNPAGLTFMFLIYRGGPRCLSGPPSQEGDAQGVNPDLSGLTQLVSLLLVSRAMCPGMATRGENQIISPIAVLCWKMAISF